MKGSSDQTLRVQSSFPITFVFGSVGTSSLGVSKGLAENGCHPAHGRGKRVNLVCPDLAIGRKRARIGPSIEEVLEENTVESVDNALNHDT